MHGGHVSALHMYVVFISPVDGEQRRDGDT